MKKPTKEIINAAKKSLDPVAAITVILNQPECAELREALIKQGLVEEVKE